jgi:amidophosphoribosyltransferase
MLCYQRLDDLIQSAREGNPDLDAFECSVFDGRYVTGDIDDAYLERLSSHRNDETRQKRAQENAGDHNVLELHNHA